MMSLVNASSLLSLSLLLLISPPFLLSAPFIHFPSLFFLFHPHLYLSSSHFTLSLVYIGTTSFKAVDVWIEDILSERGQDVVIVLVGNKVDLEVLHES
jgi:hypothetical protein